MAVPSYVMGLGDFGPPPYVFSNLTSVTFILNAAPSQLDAICKTYLNDPLGRTQDKDKFVPNGAYRVLMCCSTFPVAEAAPPPAPEPPTGYSAYQEVAFLFSVFDKKRQEWSWFAPVLYLDGPATDDEEWQAELPIAVGREMYGLPKIRGEIEFHPTYHTGTMQRIHPMYPNYKVQPADAIDVALGPCNFDSIEDQIATENAQLIGLLIEERQLRQRRARRPKLERARRKIKVAQRRIRKLTIERDALLVDRREAMADLIQLKRHLDELRPLTPEAMIQILWGGDPYASVGAQRPPDRDVWLERLGFIKKRRGSIRPPEDGGRRLLMDSSGPIELSEPDPQGDYEFVYWLLGLRQLHNPDPTKFGEAAVQRILRTSLRFDRLPTDPAKRYCVSVKDSPMAQKLGIGPQKQPVPPSENFIYEGATAWFGEVSAPL